MGSIGRAHEQFLVLAFYCLIVILFKEINVLYLIYDIHNIVVIITVAQGKYSSSEYREPWSDILTDQGVISAVTHLVKISS